MAIVNKTDQLRYLGKGPLDAKSLVKTYAELFSTDTWVKNDVFTAYNGMIVAVWLNKEDTTKNGIYFLFDPQANTALKKPDFAQESNWHKLVEIADLNAQLTSIDARLAALEEESDVVTYGYRAGFPTEGEDGKLYVAADEKKSYVWFAGEYLLVSGSSSEAVEPDVIYGGSAD
jgi:hypothetical protein